MLLKPVQRFERGQFKPKIEVTSTFPALKDRLAEAMKRYGLRGVDLAEALGITPEWVSKILNGHVVGSEDIGLRLDAYLRSRGGEVHSTSKPEVASIRPSENRTGEDLSDQLAAALHADFKSVLDMAGSNRDRLGWLRVQLDQMSAVARSWLSLEEVNERARRKAAAMTEESRRRRALLEHDAGRSRKAG